MGEAVAAEAAGLDLIVAEGGEAGGHVVGRTALLTGTRYIIQRWPERPDDKTGETAPEHAPAEQGDVGRAI